MKGRKVNKTVMNLTVAVIIGMISAELIIKKTPVGRMLGI